MVDLDAILDYLTVITLTLPERHLDLKFSNRGEYLPSDSAIQ